MARPDIETGDFGVLRLEGEDTARFGTQFRPTMCTRVGDELLAIFVSLDGEQGVATLSIGRNGSLHYVTVIERGAVFGYGACPDARSRSVLILLPDRPEISFSDVILQPLSTSGLNRAGGRLVLNGVLRVPPAIMSRGRGI